VTDISIGIPVIDYFLALLADHGYSITFAFAFLENLFVVGSVVPGETVQMAAGFVSSSGAIHPFVVWVWAFVGSFAGGNMSYFIGRNMGRPGVKQLLRRSRLGEHRLVAAEAYFVKHGSETILLSRWVAGFKNFVPAVAGMSKMPLMWFELYSLIGAFFYTTALVVLGYFFGEYLGLAVDLVKGSAWAALGLIVVISLYSYVRVKLRRRRRGILQDAKEATQQFDAISTEDE